MIEYSARRAGVVVAAAALVASGLHCRSADGEVGSPHPEGVAPAALEDSAATGASLYAFEMNTERAATSQGFACHVLASYIDATDGLCESAGRACRASSPAPFVVFDPARPGTYTEIPCGVVQSMACMSSAAERYDACVADLACSGALPEQRTPPHGDEGGGEATGSAAQPLTPVGILICAIGASMAIHYGCTRSWPGRDSLCNGMATGWASLCFFL